MRHSKPSIKISSFTKHFPLEAKVVRSEVTAPARYENGGFGWRTKEIMDELSDVVRKIWFDHFRVYCEKIGTTLEDVIRGNNVEIKTKTTVDGGSFIGTNLVAVYRLIDPPSGDNFLTDINKSLLGDGAMRLVEERIKGMLPLLNEIAVSKFDTGNDREPFGTIVAFLRFEKLQEGEILPLLLFAAGGLMGEMGERVKTDKSVLISILSETAKLLTRQMGQNGAHREFYIEVDLGQAKERPGQRVKNMEDDRMLVTGTFLEM